MHALFADVVPLRRAHAHNDYEHVRPLFDALHHGFTSVEADIWLVDGQLLVVQDLEGTRPGRTLQSLYLDPVSALVRANRGHVYPTPAPFTLLIDVKSETEATYLALREALAPCRGAD